MAMIHVGLAIGQTILDIDDMTTENVSVDDIADLARKAEEWRIQCVIASDSVRAG